MPATTSSPTTDRATQFTPTQAREDGSGRLASRHAFCRVCGFQFTPTRPYQDYHPGCLKPHKQEVAS